MKYKTFQDQQSLYKLPWLEIMLNSYDSHASHKILSTISIPLICTRRSFQIFESATKSIDFLYFVGFVLINRG